jgi:hypothetical protein
VDEFGYLSVIISVILGLSIAQLLQGIGQIINARDRVRLYWPAVGWAVLLLLINVQAWWAMFGYRFRQNWTFIQFTVVLLEAIILYLLAAIVLPNIPDEGETDLRSNYFRHAAWFFGLLVVLVLDSLLKSIVVSGHLPRRADVAFHLIWMTGAFVTAFVRDDRYHKVFICFSFILFIAYIALLFASLR